MNARDAIACAKGIGWGVLILANLAALLAGALIIAA